MKFIWEIQAWISFSKPPAILECSQSGGPLLPMSEGRDEPCTVHPGIHGCDSYWALAYIGCIINELKE